MSFALTEDAPKFLSAAFVEREKGDTIAIGVMKENGDAYAFARISLEQFRAACVLVDPE